MLLAFVWHCILIIRNEHNTTCVGKITSRRYHPNRYQTLSNITNGARVWISWPHCVDSTSSVSCSAIYIQANERIRFAAWHDMCRFLLLFGYCSFSAPINHEDTAGHTPRNSNTHVVSVSISYLGLFSIPSAFGSWNQGNSRAENENEANSQNRQEGVTKFRPSETTICST